jgi:predicted RNA-binding protein (virulence factor B family)
MSIDETLKVGVVNTLRVARDTDFGLYLEAKDAKEVLLPNAYAYDTLQIDDIIDVFLYTDSEDRIVATTLRPKAMLGEYGYFKVVDYKSYGAFIDWGLPKDLLVPLGDQKEYFNIGKWYILRVCLDEQTGRLYGTQKIGKWLSTDMTGIYPAQAVKMFIIAKTPLGYKVIVDGKFEGMLFDSEIFEPLNIGETKDGTIKNVRKDGKLDCLLASTKITTEDSSQKVLDELSINNGVMPFTYKSDAKEIYETFGMSKKSFKKALTELIDDDKIILTEKEIALKL